MDWWRGWIKVSIGKSRGGPVGLPLLFLDFETFGGFAFVFVHDLGVDLGGSDVLVG